MAESGYKNTVAIKQQGNEIKRRTGKDVNSYLSALGKIRVMSSELAVIFIVQVRAAAHFRTKRMVAPHVSGAKEHLQKASPGPRRTGEHRKRAHRGAGA
jgi:hypothetical protein